MSRQEFRQFTRHDKLLLPKLSNHDDFLQVMEKMFQYSCAIGVIGSRKYICYVWSASLLTVFLYMEIHAIWKVIKALAGWAIDMAGHRSVTARVSGTIFYTISIMSLILNSKLCYSWRHLSKLWARVEWVTAANAPVDRTLKRRMYTFTVFMTTCSMLEHVMGMISTIGLNCPPSLIIKRYVLISHGFMILKNEYSEWYFYPLVFMRTIGTLLSIFLDQLIVLISMGLTSRYRRLNQCLEKICAMEKKTMSFDIDHRATKIYTWRKIREAYVKQAMLVRRVDDAIGGIIVLSCLTNFYFIILQLFLCITQGQSSDPIKTVYYFMSLAWLFIRLGSVVLSGSNITAQSRMALKHIYSYDSHHYNVEVDRLQNQLRKDHIALSGMGFFSLNKTILLQMAGAIITYELVLIQFDDKGSDNLQLNITKI